MVVINTSSILLRGLICGVLVTTVIACKIKDKDVATPNFTGIDRRLQEYADEVFSKDTYNIITGVRIERAEFSEDEVVAVENEINKEDNMPCNEGRSVISLEDYVLNRFDKYARTHVISVNAQDTARWFNFATGKSSFLTGFGLGFIAFGLKKLLLPIFIGAQILKSVLIAMFLPSILGSLGKLVGKGLSQASGLSGSSGHQQQAIDDFDFKDTGTPYNAEGTQDDYPALAAAPDYNFPAATTTTTTQTATQQAMNRFGNEDYYQKVLYPRPQSENYYLRRPNKQHDYKVFHKIPTSSLLLTTYDPFYSPLLSRLDSIFQQLGLGDGKGPEVEKCRERLVCLMYANPAKYAPYSNLVSTQLSRELNELRKPSSDNPEILRFFRYMKAAKDGQDGEQCHLHNGCPSLQADQPRPAMLTTFNDINKLVQARILH